MSSEFNWKVEAESKILGKIKKPIANISIKNAEEEWQEFIFKVDSGAVMTLMGKEDCEFLGYNIFEGQQHNFKAANNSTIPAFIHKLTMKIGEIEIPEVKIAFALQDIGDYLLGRETIFNHTDILFRGRIGKTIFTK